MKEFAPNITLSHYRITSKLGSGGMGDVYLAQDTSLDRKVALKILPREVATDQMRMRRFVQEAKAAAALNHPNIAHTYEIGEENGVNFIAMEYVEGETLRALLTRSRPDLPRAVEFAAQVCSGLAMAHHAGIVHRDIKPDNLIVANGSTIKILDFGLAKLVEKQRPLSDLTDLSTAVYGGDGAHATSAGVILGTVSYMSPEQARGEKLDQSSDIFSMGTVLYEMLSGQRPFDGNSTIDTLHAIINQEPQPITNVNTGLPPEIREILEKALAKDPSERYRDAGDFELDLRRFKRALSMNSLASSQIQGTAGLTTHEKARSSGWLWIAVGLLLSTIVLAALLLNRSRATDDKAIDLAKVTITSLTTDPGYEGEPTFSPDGQIIAYVSDRTGNFEIFFKQISGGPDLNITNNLADDVQPAYSPDGKQIAFVSTRAGTSNLIYPGVDFSLLGGDIWVMTALGGSPKKIAESGNFPSWSPDGTAILYTSGTSWFQPKMRRVSSQGGEVKDIAITFQTGVRPAPFWVYPSYSPDGLLIAFEANGRIFVVNAEGGEAIEIVKGQHPVWSTDGQSITYSNRDPGGGLSVWQVPFSTSERKVSGAAYPITVGRGRDMQPTISRDGKLIAFAAQDLSFNLERLPFDAETGRQTGDPKPATSGQNAIYFFSSYGPSLIFGSEGGLSSHIWRVDPGSPAVQLTTDEKFSDSAPQWSPDGQTIAFIRRSATEVGQSVGGASSSLWLMSADGANPRMLVANAGNPKWMPSGGAIAYGSVVDGRQNQLNIFDLTTGSTRRLTNEVGVVPICVFSPDGKWLIYQSNANGNIDLRAIPVEGGESRVVVATPHQDYHPSVSPTGNWLYLQLDHKNVYRVPGPAQNWRKADPEKMTNFPESGLFLEDPQISRDGRELLYSHGRITGDLCLINLGK